ncbi:hypothetical protein D9M71_208810 [compost metagenome]
MGLRVDVGVHAQRHRRLDAQLGGHLLQALQLDVGLDVEAVHADLQRTAHVVAALADAGEDDLARFAAGGQHAFQLAARDDVEACAEAGQHVEHAEVGVGLDCEAHQVRHAGQRVGVGVVLRLDVGARIDVGGGAEALGNRGQRRAFREQLAAAVVERLHAGLLKESGRPRLGGMRRTLRIRNGLCCYRLFHRPEDTADPSGRSR